MRGKWSRRSIDRLENLLIALLACSALVLIVQSGLGQAAGRGTGSGGETVFTGVQGTALSRGTPVRMMVQTEHGRYGVQYDQDTVDTLYAGGISQLLTEAVEAMDTPHPATREDWQEAITQSSRWVYCDFLYNISFVAQGSGGEGAGRAFLLSAPGGRVEAVYYYNQETGEYYAGRVAGAALTFPSTLEGLGDNGARFAFEDPQVAEILSPDTLVLSQAPVTPVYAVANPVAAWGEAEHTALLEALDFNLRAIALYETTEGTVLQEGSDTLRLQKDGQVLYHAADRGQARFQALSSREKDLQLKAEEVLDLVTGAWLGEGRMFCQAIEAGEEEQVTLTFCCLLSGAQVQRGEEGWSAQFTFTGQALTSFTICLRTYTDTGRVQQALPERQAAAAAAAMGQAGKELQLCYLDDGAASELSAAWTIRET